MTENVCNNFRHHRSRCSENHDLIVIPYHWFSKEKYNGWLKKNTDLMTQCHDDVIKWKHFPRYFVRGIHRSPVNFPHKGQWRGALMFSLICVWVNRWVNNREAGDLRRFRAHHDVTVMWCIASVIDPPWPDISGRALLEELLSLVRFDKIFATFNGGKAFDLQQISTVSVCKSTDVI